MFSFYSKIISRNEHSRKVNLNSSLLHNKATIETQKGLLLITHDQQCKQRRKLILRGEKYRGTNMAACSAAAAVSGCMAHAHDFTVIYIFTRRPLVVFFFATSTNKGIADHSPRARLNRLY